MKSTTNYGSKLVIQVTRWCRFVY